MAQTIVDRHRGSAGNLLIGIAAAHQRSESISRHDAQRQQILRAVASCPVQAIILDGLDEKKKK